MVISIALFQVWTSQLYCKKQDKGRHNKSGKRRYVELYRRLKDNSECNQSKKIKTHAIEPNVEKADGIKVDSTKVYAMKMDERRADTMEVDMKKVDAMGVQARKLLTKEMGEPVCKGTGRA